MDEDELKNDGVAIVVVLVAFTLLGLIGYLLSSRTVQPTITGSVIVSSTVPFTTSTSPIEL